MLVGPGLAFRLGARGEREGLTQEMDTPVVTLDDEPSVDEPLQGAERGPGLEPGAAPNRVEIGRAEHQSREHRPAVAVGEQADQLPRGERRRRHAS